MARASKTSNVLYRYLKARYLAKYYTLITYPRLNRLKKFHVPGSFVISCCTQSRRPFYDYVHPMESVTGPMTQLTRYPNYYGSSSPNMRYRMEGGACGRVPFTEPGRIGSYNNYAFHSDMQEVENPYIVPRVCVENPEVNGKNYFYS